MGFGRWGAGQYIITGTSPFERNLHREKDYEVVRCSCVPGYDCGSNPDGTEPRSGTLLSDLQAESVPPWGTHDRADTKASRPQVRFDERFFVLCS